MRIPNRSYFYIFGFLFLVSGIAGLIYEIVWERLLEIYFGVTNVSITLIVVAYMAGLGLGSLFGGKLSVRIKSILRAYGLVEIGIALFGLISPSLIVWVGVASAGSPPEIVFLISFGILLIPTFLMGMTLPLLAQAFIMKVEKAGEIIGLLYGINTLGAAFGSFLAAYVFIGRIGLEGTVYVACALNAAVGLASILLSRNRQNERANLDTTDHTPDQRILDSRVQWSYQTILAVSFLVGFLGLGYEMLWVRILSIINKNTVYGFPTILGVFLVGLAWGGYYFGRKADRTRQPVQMFWKLEVSVAVVSAMAICLYWVMMEWPPLRDAIHSVFRNPQRPSSAFVLIDRVYLFSRRELILGLIYYFVPVVWIVFPASFLMGGGLPMLDRIAINNPQIAGKRVGAVHLANILGSLCGALLVSYALLSWLGTELTLKFLVLLSLIFVVGGAYQKTKRMDDYRVEFVSILIIFLAVYILPGRESLYESYFSAGTNNQSPIIQEYSDGVLALTSPYLWIRGDEHGSYPSDGNYESHAAVCVSAVHPKRTLIIGLGGGNTAYFLTKIPGVEEIVIVELMAGLDEFLYDLAPTVKEILTDPRVTYIIDDGRRYLYANPSEKFDLISIDPLHNYSGGHNNLYSIEAQRLYLAHLNPGGIFCQWYDERHYIPKVTANVFPEMDSFRNFSLASDSPIRYDAAYMRLIIDNYLKAAGDHLHPSAAEHLDAGKILLRYSRDRQQIQTEESNTPFLTDFTPWLEYYLLRKPLDTPILPRPQTLRNFIGRLDGCDETCLAPFYEWLNKLSE